MSFKNRIFLIILVIVLVALAAVFLAPMTVSNGVRLWVWWFARQEGFVATIEEVDAPFLRPIMIRQIHLKSVRNDAVRVDITLIDTRVVLNLKHILLHLRGATHWETNRLMIAGLTLTRGLDLQSATLDLSRLGNRRIGLQFDVDAFGGKLRANISHEWHSPHSNWKIAGGASDLSLAQISDALGFADRVNGLLHSSNFTFRGNLAEPERATASLWGELTGLTWRERTAEALMLGAALYNRKIELQQLYIRQKSNQFTLSGEAALPATSSEWLRPDFRGNVSAYINQLGEFLALFGANPADFAGKISIQGSMDTHARNFGGNLAIEGASLTFFKHEIDKFTAKVSLKPSELEIERFDLARNKDFLSGEGKIDLSPEHKYSGKLDAWADDLRDYVPTITRSPKQNAKPIPVELQATIDSSQWDTRGVIAQ